MRHFSLAEASIQPRNSAMKPRRQKDHAEVPWRERHLSGFPMAHALVLGALAFWLLLALLSTYLDSFMRHSYRPRPLHSNA